MAGLVYNSSTVRLRQKDQKFQATLGCGAGLVFDVHNPVSHCATFLAPVGVTGFRANSHAEICTIMPFLRNRTPQVFVHSNINRTKMAYLSHFRSKAGLQNA